MDWHALLSTLGLVFVAELGDKTQLAVITQTCKFRRPWAVFWGASVALTAVTLIGALGGRVLGQFMPANVLRTIAAIAFVLMGLLVAREAARSSKGDGCALVCEGLDPDESRISPRREWRAFGATFVLLFVAELGDKTQLAVLSLSSQNSATWAVFAGGALALTLVTGLGVIGGQGLCRLIPQRLLLSVSAAAFVVMGALMLMGWL